MSVDETPAMAPLTDFSSKINNCVQMMERKLSLALMPDYLSIKKDKELHKLWQRHEFFCERLEMADLHNSRESHEHMDAVVKKTFKNVCSVLVQCNPNLDYQYVKGGLPKDLTEVQRLFINNLKMIISNSFRSSQKEVKVTVPKETDQWDTILEQLSTNLTVMDSLTDQCKCEIQNMRLKMEEEPENACCRETQLYLEEATIKQTGLQKELDQLKIQINNMYSENRDKERQIQEATEIVMDEMEYMFQTFDDSMRKEQADLEAREEEFQKCEEELMKTERLCKALEVQYKEVLEKRRLKEERKKEEIRILQLKTRAVIIAQAWWRGYKVRKALKEQSKRKAKKGKKSNKK